MPTYDYECDGCGHSFEIWQSFKDNTMTKCPECKKNKLRRLFGGGAAIIFKGSGFYETDYRQKDEAKKTGKPTTDAEPKSESETKSDTKKESTSAETSKPEAPTKVSTEASPKSIGKAKKPAGS
jgi:putative FmdB family regulatory protein